MTNTSTVLKKALKKEKDARVNLRIVAINMVVVKGQRVDDVAGSLMMSEDWVRQWVDRYESGGLDALRDRPRTGRPPKVRADKLAKIVADASKKRCCRAMSATRWSGRLAWFTAAGTSGGSCGTTACHPRDSSTCT